VTAAAGVRVVQAYLYERHAHHWRIIRLVASLDVIRSPYLYNSYSHTSKRKEYLNLYIDDAAAAADDK